MASLIEFLEAVGLENMTVQTLHQCITGVAMERKGGAKVSFLTNEITPSDAFGEMKRTAFIVWMDAKKFDAALEKTKGK
ncbi:hypothetical protein [Enterobacter bugandensis]|uniref:hypothetical protein n=1 Tax=Enterobacter bugandensis TaxID=881260 RepID=UPI0012B835A7|nr:hypothetical protein [Enterobacter bugandensis]EIW7013794.1 hypothetical protein [Escherichia coli]